MSNEVIPSKKVAIVPGRYKLYHFGHLMGHFR